jgi:hypothetical protein
MLLALLALGLAIGSPVRATPTGLGAGGSLPRQQVVRRAVAGDSSEAYLLYLPAAAGPAARVFVDVHGISRNVEEHAALFAPFAERYGVILVAPCFTRGDHTGYQWLAREADGRRADLDLDAISTTSGH